jgi:tetratricopeptide (TPR) repeat protein
MPARIGAALAAALFLASLNPSDVTAAEPWIEVRSPGRATVVTDAGEKAGRKVAFQVVQFDRALERRFSWLQGDGDSSLLVFTSEEDSMIRAMAPDGADPENDHAFASYHVTSTGHMGVLRADLKDPSDKERSPFRGFYRGRAAQLVERSLGKSAPAWLTRGLITFLADTVVKDKEILTGRMTLSEGDGASLKAPSSAEFFRDGRAHDRRSDLLAGLFIHYLLVGDGGKQAPALNDMLESFAARDEGPVVQAALGRVMALYGGFPKHLTSKKFSPLKLPADASLRSANFLVRALPEAEALMLRAEALFDLNRPVDTRGLLRQVKEADPTLVRPLEIEAVLFEREQRSAESRQAIEAAIKLGTKNGSLYYRLAQTQWARTMTRPALLSTQTLLETARDLSPGDGSTLSYLAEVQSDLGLVDKALENARAGVTIAPADVYARMSLARALWNARQVDEALTTAREALKVARVASQKQRVQEFINFATKNRRLQGRGARPYASQFGPPPAGAFGATRSAAAGTSRVNVGRGADRTRPTLPPSLIVSPKPTTRPVRGPFPLLKWPAPTSRRRPASRSVPSTTEVSASRATAPRRRASIAWPAPLRTKPGAPDSRCSKRRALGCPGTRPGRRRHSRRCAQRRSPKAASVWPRSSSAPASGWIVMKRSDC